MIYDRYGRPVLNFRLSLTQRCSLKCPYCHREGEPLGSRIEMTSEEITRIVRIAAKLGITGVKLTGGEPLLREDIVEIVRSIASTPGIRDVSMTTNATRLVEKAVELKEAGLQRVNVNLPTLDPSTYAELTGGHIRDVIQGIEKALSAGLRPVKLNMLVLRGINEEEIPAILNFCREKDLVPQLIELEPVNVPPDYYDKYHLPLDDITGELEAMAVRVDIRRFMQNRKVLYLPGVKVEVVPPVENSEFCFYCTRIRLTSDGKLKPCLMRNDNLVDILTPLRSGADDDMLASLFLEAVNRREPHYKLKPIP